MSLFINNFLLSRIHGILLFLVNVCVSITIGYNGLHRGTSTFVGKNVIISYKKETQHNLKYDLFNVYLAVLICVARYMYFCVRCLVFAS